jgi:pyruvate formate lyase activating enzyme
MNFSGFQKLTLLDYPGKVACTLFTSGCNLRCPFCHNASLVTHIDNSNIYKKEEILAYLKKRQGILDGVCISGGEPLLHAEIEGFISEVKSLGYSVKLDTNGFFPEKLISLVNKGLVDYVAVDFKSTYEKYSLATGIESLDITPFKKTVEFLLSGAVDYEFRTTVVKGIHETQDTVEKIGVDKAKNLISQADIVLFLVDSNREYSADDEEIYNSIKNTKYIILRTKSDLAENNQKHFEDEIEISIKNNQGIDKLKEKILNLTKISNLSSGSVIITNERHKNALIRSNEAIKRAIENIELDSLDLIAIDIKQAYTEMHQEPFYPYNHI